MLKWLFKKLGYVHESELEFHHCNCCSTKATWNMVARYYDDAIMKQVEDVLVYGEGMSTVNTGEPNITWTRLSPEKVYKKGAKRGKSKKASSK